VECIQYSKWKVDWTNFHATILLYTESSEMPLNNEIRNANGTVVQIEDC